jgi:hypothetical protein
VADLPEFLRPVREAEPRPDPEIRPGQARYVRSYLWMRIGIGALGVVLPLWLVIADKVAFHGDPFPRGSLSAYYYSGMRDVFVAILSATGVFLITHQVAEKNLDNTATLIAGLCACLIPLFPTGRPSGHVALTSLQDLLGETTVKTIHFVASALFIGLLAVMSYHFGKREGGRPRREGTRRSPTFWKWYHWVCSMAMVLAILWIAVTLSVGWPPRSLLIGEWVATWAFGASFLGKGAELDMLFGRPNPPS